MNDDDLTPQRIARLTPVADVLARIAALVQPVAPREISVDDAAGRGVAIDIVAPHNLPAVAIALRDGYAVAAADTMDAGGYTPVRFTSAPPAVGTGDPLTARADAVAPPDIIVAQHGAYEVLAQVAAGDGVLAAHGDIRAGTVLLRAGARVRATDQAILALAGIERIPVRAPNVQIIAMSTNDAVLDTTASLIARLLVADGAEPKATRLDLRGDPAAAFADPDADATVVIGGSGLGAADRSIQVLARAGHVETHGVAISPGETAAFGRIGSRPVLVLPGRIDAALAVWLVLGRHMLARLAASTIPGRSVPVRLGRKISSSLGLAEVVPVRLQDTGAEPIASGYLPWSALAQADGWILIPADSEGYPPSTEVMLRPWP